MPAHHWHLKGLELASRSFGLRSSIPSTRLVDICLRYRGGGSLRGNDRAETEEWELSVGDVLAAWTVIDNQTPPANSAGPSLSTADRQAPNRDFAMVDDMEMLPMAFQDCDCYLQIGGDNLEFDSKSCNLFAKLMFDTLFHQKFADQHYATVFSELFLFTPASSILNIRPRARVDAAPVNSGLSHYFDTGLLHIPAGINSPPPPEPEPFHDLRLLYSTCELCTEGSLLDPSQSQFTKSSDCFRFRSGQNTLSCLGWNQLIDTLSLNSLPSVFDSRGFHYPESVQASGVQLGNNWVTVT